MEYLSAVSHEIFPLFGLYRSIIGKRKKAADYPAASCMLLCKCSIILQPGHLTHTSKGFAHRLLVVQGQGGNAMSNSWGNNGFILLVVLRCAI